MNWICPVCDGETRRIFSVRREFPVRQCTSCPHRFAEYHLSNDHVSAVYSDDYFFGGGAGYPDYLREGPLLRAHGARYGRLLRSYSAEPGSKLLDVGGASGFVADGLRSQGWDPAVLEPNTRMAGYARDQLHLSVYSGALEEFNPAAQFDAVTMIQVVAHFADVRAAFLKAASLTRQGGLWLIETWDSQSITARLFGTHWHEYNPPSVLHYFSEASLRALAARCGMAFVASGHPRKNIMWGHARSLVENQVSWRWLNALTRIVPDQATIPYPSEDLRWTVFRKQQERTESLN